MLSNLSLSTPRISALTLYASLIPALLYLKYMSVPLLTVFALASNTSSSDTFLSGTPVLASWEAALLTDVNTE